MQVVFYASGPPRLLIDVKNSKWLTCFCILLCIIVHYYAFVIVFLTWLAYFLSHDYLSYINSLGFLSIFCFSLTKGQICSKRYTILSVLAVHRPFYILTYACMYFTLHDMFKETWESSDKGKRVKGGGQITKSQNQKDDEVKWKWLMKWSRRFLSLSIAELHQEGRRLQSNLY